MTGVHNGMSASLLGDVAWHKSRHSNPNGNCVEIARLADGRVAVRNSRHPAGPVLVYRREDVLAFVESTKAGDFDDLLGGRRDRLHEGVGRVS
ncbi:DUF397 domain-containing protein [Microbispora sp. RL4-1S]|uniref:DUF397 domain-containing protein n=1 Tax=Microbispora oryzae TaxID=2806554 RepID=A0A940WI78_9ACTN|nr:DUF397 domain-containing protein [Microbispora oryzae]MBP2706204.1 DUF397 domain-containing protein [Microbispora oryzae]